MSRITDYAPEHGAHEGADLAYGRANGETPEHGKDYPANRDESGHAQNKPIMSRKLIEQRDVALWTKDESVKDAKRDVGSSQHYINYMITMYVSNLRYLRANMHLKVGKQRL